MVAMVVSPSSLLMVTCLLLSPALATQLIYPASTMPLVQNGSIYGGYSNSMARLMPLLLVAASAQEMKGVKHVLAGTEYSGTQGTREDKSFEFGGEIPLDKFKDCKPQGSDSRSLNDFTTEDIEKANNVSFSEPEYTNKVLLVVNLASF